MIDLITGMRIFHVFGVKKIITLIAVLLGVYVAYGRYEPNIRNFVEGKLSIVKEKSEGVKNKIR